MENTIKDPGMIETLYKLFSNIPQNNPMGLNDSKPSFKSSTGSFKQNQRKERKKSWRRKVRSFR